MSNQFRKPIEEIDEPELSSGLGDSGSVEDNTISNTKEAGTAPENAAELFFRKLFTEGVITKESATEMLPFIIYLCVLGMVYIGNSHMALTNIRNIDKLNKEVKELSSEYKSLKADLMFKSKMTEVAAKVDTLGIKELTEPPKKIVVNR